MADAKVFWQQCRRKSESLREFKQGLVEKARRSGNPADLLGQPPTGQSIYISSREDPSIDVPGGVVVEASFNLAGQRCVEGSHGVATPQEIADYLEVQRLNAEAIAAENAKVLNPNRQVILLKPATATPTAKVKG